MFDREFFPLKCGLQASVVLFNNGHMKKNLPQNSQLYGWDSEPVDERPSEFMESTGYAMLSGYHPMNDPARRARPRSGVGLKTMLMFCVVIVALGGFALVKMAALLRG